MAYDYLVQKRLSERTGFSASQVQTLLVLLDYPIMDYRVVEALKLFPPSKMRSRVLEPLRESGWIVIHSYPPSSDAGGASRMAWSLRTEKALELRALVMEVRREVDQAQSSALRYARALATDMLIEAQAE